jgi:fructokinase
MNRCASGLTSARQNIKAAVLGRDDEVKINRRVATRRNDDDVPKVIDEFVGWLETAVNSPCLVDIGMFGNISPQSGLVKNVNTVVLNGRSLDRDLSALRIFALGFDNDDHSLLDLKP